MPKGKPKSQKLAEPTPVPKPLVQRVRDHNTYLAAVVKDDRISGNRRLLAVLLSKYFSLGTNHGKEVPMTEQEAKDKNLLYNVIVEQYGNPRNIRWLDAEDAGPTETPNRETVEATDKIKEAFDAAMQPIKKEA